MRGDCRENQNYTSFILYYCYIILTVHRLHKCKRLIALFPAALLASSDPLYLSPAAHGV